MSLAGAIATAAVPKVLDLAFRPDEPLPESDAALEAEYLKAKSQLAAWALEEQKGDAMGLLLAGASGLVGGLYAPLPR